MTTTYEAQRLADERAGRLLRSLVTRCEQSELTGVIVILPGLTGLIDTQFRVSLANGSETGVAAGGAGLDEAIDRVLDETARTL